MMIEKDVKLSSHADLNADADSGIEREPSQSEADSADSKRGIFIRLTPDAKEILHAAKGLMAKSTHGQKTYGGVIQKLLEYYERQAFPVKENILKGVPSSPLKESEDLLARLHRAQHAFETKRFYFAIKTYSTIARGLTGFDSSDELLDVCRFRLAHCWNQLSYTLRSEALDYDPHLKDAKEQTERFYALAGRALDMALSCLKKLKDENDDLMALIKNYNMACCYSLKAQYIVESSLEPNGPPGDLMRDARKDRKKTEELWLNSIGLIWGRLDSEGAAKKAAKQGLDWLSKICPSNESSSGPSGSFSDARARSESIWVVNEARDDPDFLFLRSAEEFKDLFRDWESDALEGASIAIAIEDLLDEQQVP